MKKIKDKIEELNEDENILGLYDAEEAIKDDKQKIAKNMLNKGIDIETIVECTSLSKEEIDELQ